ncbi:MAG TPA: 30S ribosomal protein S6 [Fibrobacteria bacterium]|nr:30S ribosomal protein S6 [Fibrobacteria bacterium]HOX51422.1 30S ribosomal protein S6 [Fibrobacteria bacterium]
MESHIHPAPGSSGGHVQREAALAKLYETVVLVGTNQEDAAIEATVRKYQDMIAAGGEIVRVDRWGKRRIAYEIQGQSHADYTVFYYHATKGSLVSEVERMLRLDESILRFLTVVDNPCGLPSLNPTTADVEPNDDADLSDKED